MDSLVNSSFHLFAELLIFYIVFDPVIPTKMLWIVAQSNLMSTFWIWTAFNIVLSAPGGIVTSVIQKNWMPSGVKCPKKNIGIQKRNVFIYHMIFSFNLRILFLGHCQLLSVENNVNLEFGLPRAGFFFSVK